MHTRGVRIGHVVILNFVMATTSHAKHTAIPSQNTAKQSEKICCLPPSVSSLHVVATQLLALRLYVDAHAPSGSSRTTLVTISC